MDPWAPSLAPLHTLDPAGRPVPALLPPQEPGLEGLKVTLGRLWSLVLCLTSGSGASMILHLPKQAIRSPLIWDERTSMPRGTGLPGLQLQ